MSHNRKRGCLTGLLAVAGLLLFVVFVVPPILWQLFPVWPKRLEHVCLEPALPVLREDQVTPDNAYYYLRQITNVVFTNDWSGLYEERLRLDALGWEGQPYPIHEQWLADNTEVLRLWDQAATCTNGQVATVVSIGHFPPIYSPVKRLCQELNYVAVRSVAQSDWGAASAIWTATLRNCSYITQGGMLFHHALGDYGKRLVCEQILKDAIEKDMPQEVMRSLMVELEKVCKQTEPMSEVIRHERLFAFAPNGIDELYRSARMLDLITIASVPELHFGWFKNRSFAALMWILGSRTHRTGNHVDIGVNQKDDGACHKDMPYLEETGQYEDEPDLVYSPAILQQRKVEAMNRFQLYIKHP